MKRLRKTIQKFANGGLFSGSGLAKIDGSIGDIRRKEKSQIENLEEQYIDPNTGIKGAVKIGSNLLSAGTSIAGAIANPSSIVGAASSVIDAAGGIADTIGQRKHGEELIDKVKDQADLDVGSAGTTKTKILSSILQADSEYKEGGKITGPGTGKSDSIDAEATPGDFIVPVENSAEAMRIGQHYLGWGRNQRASLSGGSEDVRLSNGEVMFTKDESDMLKKSGVNVKGLAPNSKKGTQSFAPGGGVEKSSAISDYFKDMDVGDKIGLGLSTAQIIGGAAIGLSKDRGQATLDRVDTSALDNAGGGFRTLADKIRKGASGIADRIKSTMTRTANQTFATEQAAISEKAGGNSSAYLKSVGKGGRRRNSAILAGDTEAAKVIANAESKAAGIEAQGLSESNRAKATKVGIQASENAKEFASESAYNMASDTAKGDAAGSLLSSGVSNIVGQIQAKQQRKRTAQRKKDSKVTYGKETKTEEPKYVYYKNKRRTVRK